MSEKKSFLARAFHDMAEDAKAQHEVDKANLAAAKAESKAFFEEQKANGSNERRKAAVKAEREKEIREAMKRKSDAEERIKAAKE